MRHRNEVLLILTLAAFALAGATALATFDGEPDYYVDPLVDPMALVEPATAASAADEAIAWFQSMRGYCNPVDVETRMRWQPAPATDEGSMRRAACYALAGRMERAREVIDGLPEGRRYEAAGIVFEAGHPAADAGDEIAAGPLMELVVSYWPSHYMALYHAGAARFERGQHQMASNYLRRFLEEYSVADGWTSNARSMLEQIAAGR